jgi:hypothetical protein
MIRPRPHRGDVIAAGVVVLTTLVAVLQIRFDATWGAGVHLVYSALAAGLVVQMAVLAPMEGDAPRAYQSVLIVAGLLLVLATLASAADVLGADRPLTAAGTIVWVGSLLTALAWWFATRRNAAVATLIAAVTGGVVTLAFVKWVFDPSSLTTFRWLLVLLTIVYVLGSLTQRDHRRRHSVQLVNAGGLAVLALAGTFAVEVFFGALGAAFSGVRGGFEAGFGWELFVLASAWGLIAYAAVDREAGAAYLGVANLLAFVLLAAPAGKHDVSLIGWPLFFAVLSGTALWVGLRPAEELPPEPGTDAPTTPLNITRS